MAEYMTDYLELDITKKEILAIERVTGEGASDDGDLRTAIHDMMEELAKFKGIDISDIDYNDGSWADI